MMPLDVEITYLGTATLAVVAGGTRLITDPVFDPKGTVYDFGPWYAPRSWFASEKQYETPVAPESLGAFDAALVTHDQHADNLDLAGRNLIADEARVARVVTTTPGARRLASPRSPKDAPGRGLGLGARASGLAPGAATRIKTLTVRATTGRHGPAGLPQVNEVIGFVIDVDDGPRIWISGDTVLTPPLRETLAAMKRERAVDVAILHCGGVGFPKALGVSHALFTFDAAQALEAARILEPGLVVPVHRSGWAHFRQPEADLRAAFAESGLDARFLELGERVTL